jgi:hypothetical protein
MLNGHPCVKGTWSRDKIQIFLQKMDSSRQCCVPDPASCVNGIRIQIQGFDDQKLEKIYS